MMNNKGVFITGTDTGVGKTLVSAVLLAMLRSAGLEAAPMKPVQTGARRVSGHWRSPDLDFCLKVAGLRPQPVEYDAMAPYCFARPCSPHLAAGLAGRGISLRRVRTCFNFLQARHAVVIVEGAGGVLVPVRGQKTMLDLIDTLDLPAVLVARAGLGTINHTLLSLQALRRAQVPVLGVIFNASAPGSPAYIENDNIKTIARLGKVRVLGRLPFVAGCARLTPGQLYRRAAAGLAPLENWIEMLDMADAI